jgi:hypothetical protein
MKGGEPEIYANTKIKLKETQREGLEIKCLKNFKM